VSAKRGTTIPNNAANDATLSKPNAWTGPMPLLYHDPQFVNLERHRHAGLRETGDYGFARETNSVPLGADEIFLMQAYCPVVFTASDPALPVAVLGIGNNNSFVDSGGKWRAGVPIPAYIRRYPFITATDPMAKRIVLALDEASSAFAMKGGRPLFENDAPSEFAKLALKFCADFQVQLDLSRMIGEAVASAGLLASRRVDVRSADGKAMSLDGFRVIDEARFNALLDETFLTWRKNNWLGVIYAHLLSMRRWEVFAGFPPQT
jgi:hypothetical protein